MSDCCTVNLGEDAPSHEHCAVRCECGHSHYSHQYVRDALGRMTDDPDGPCQKCRCQAFVESDPQAKNAEIKRLKERVADLEQRLLCLGGDSRRRE